ncbi:MAG TPA: Uma2 family endonuclease [Gemmataceae bacterium]|nr:Uma2 family endonuclease [Gemmataceae bacterium]
MSTLTLAKSSEDTDIADDELYEVIDGKRVRTPAMAAFATWIACELYRHLGNFANADLGRAVTEMLFHLPAPIDRDRRPDVAFVSYQRWAKNRPIPRQGRGWDVIPNIAAEVVSPTDIEEELDDKIAEYFRAGVQLVWVVYPNQSKILAYSSPTQIKVVLRDDDLDAGELLPGFRLRLAELFADAAEPLTSNGKSD